MPLYPLHLPGSLSPLHLPASSPADFPPLQSSKHKPQLMLFPQPHTPKHLGVLLHSHLLCQAKTNVTLSSHLRERNGYDRPASHSQAHTPRLWTCTCVCVPNHTGMHSSKLMPSCFLLTPRSAHCSRSIPQLSICVCCHSCTGGWLPSPNHLLVSGYHSISCMQSASQGATCPHRKEVCLESDGMGSD